MDDDLRALDDDQRTPPPDPIAQLIADLDQSLAMIPHLARLLAAEHTALKAEGVPGVEAAVIVGTRWKS